MVEKVKVKPLKDAFNEALSRESKESEITYEKAWMNIGVILFIVLGIILNLAKI